MKTGPRLLGLCVNEYGLGAVIIMGIRSGFKKLSKAVFNFRVDLWLDYKNLKGHTSYLYNQFRTLYHIQPNARTETFEEAVERLELTPELLALQKKRYHFLIYFYLGLSCLIFCYSAWLICSGNWMGTCMAISVGLYALSFAFRYHFWNYQIQRQQLACSFQDWLNDFLSSKVTQFIKIKGKTA